MRVWSSFVVVLAAATAMWAQQEGAADPDARDLLVRHGGVAAKVNGQVILADEVDAALSTERRQLEETCPDRESLARKWAELWRKTLREMVEQRVMLMTARAEGIEVTDREVDLELARQIKNSGSKDALMAALAENGLAWEEHEERVRIDLIEREVVKARLGVGQRVITPTSKMPRDITVRPEEIRQHYAAHRADYLQPERVKARVISLGFDAGRREERREEAESILRQIRDGADMALLALWYSDEHAAEGGFMGWTERSAVPTAVWEALLAMKDGEVCPAVETADAFVIVRREGYQEARQRPIEEDAVQDEIRSLLWNRRVNACIAEIRRELVKGAYVEPADLFEGP